MDLNNKKILFIKQSSLGDVIHALPVAHAIKRVYPGSSIGWVVEKGYARLLENDPCVTTVYPIHIPSTSSPGDEKSAYWKALIATLKTMFFLKRQLKQNQYDLIFDMHASFRSGLLSLMNPGGVRFGFADAKEMNPLFHHEKIKNDGGKEHALEKNFLFCEHFNIPMDPSDLYLLASESDQKITEKFLAEHQFASYQSFIYANPAARWKTKFWPVEHWAELADKMHAVNRPIIFGGSAADIDYIQQIAAMMITPPVVAAGKLELTQSIALIQKSSAYVGLDSGPMHIAAMSGTPTVALFGPTHPEKVGPYGVKSKVVQAEGLDCLCCRKRSCETLQCMKGISVHQVYSALCEILEM